MKNPLFTGVCTALVTPFQDGKINYPMLERLIHRQIKSGVKAIVVGGTTGESATLSDHEKIELVANAKQTAGENCLILAGTGSNNTAHAASLCESAENAGADGLLVVTPYYNKATPEGLSSHFRYIADTVHIPVILYNVPSRTGVDLPVSVCRELSMIPNIAGLKEASTDMTKLLTLRAECPEDFTIWSGNDDLTVPILSLGGKGVVSVVSNLLPEVAVAMASAALDGDFDTAAALQIELLPVTTLLQRQVNPIPVKAAMKLLGYDCGECRLPLTAASSEILAGLRTVLT